MPEMIDIANQRFGQLVALTPVFQRERKWYWLCRCDCGKSATVQGKKLRTGHTQSCGCLKKANGEYHITHGQARKNNEAPEYYTWKAMLRRCRSPNATDFKYYGGRGISVCERWLQFENFLADMGRRPSPKHSIDRVNNDGNYEPDNCRWATHSDQMKNKRYPIRKLVR